MLLLHAADLHLGKTIRERDLLDDQAWALDAMLDAVARRRPAALLVAGDVYDRSIPPPEAIRLFDSFLSRAVEAAPDMAIVIVPGNHDSAARLSFGASLLERAGVHFRTRPEDCVIPVVVESGGERAAIWALPYLGPGAFGPGTDGAGGPFAEAASAGAPAARPGPGELPFDEPEAEAAASPEGRSQAELFARAMRAIGERILPDSRNVLLAHCFAAGGRASESERAFVGLAEQVDASLLGRFDYAALGHLHRFQAAGERGRYAGSPLAYSFSEGEEDKGFVLAEVSPGGLEAELVPIKPKRAMRRLEGPFSVLAAPGARPECREDYVEARLTDLEPILNPADPLRVNFPNLLSVRQAAFELAAAPQAEAPLASAAPGAEEAGASAVAEDFAAFHRAMRGSGPDAEASALFAELLKEAEREAD
jgi:exonuclease SbcD